jgi:1,4-alpha-glucan branching enzyme
LDPGKLEAMVATAEADAPDAPANPRGSRAARRAGGAASRSASAASVKPMAAEFQIRASRATSVKLASDFTEGEKFPLDMIVDEEGTWFLTTWDLLKRGIARMADIPHD